MVRIHFNQAWPEAVALSSMFKICECCLQDAERVNTFKHRMNTLAYGEAMMAAARDYGKAWLFACPAHCAV
jgi:hypothetical protein